ncbi:tetratricopeptide repeat protein [Anaerolineales bacterium HSG6]|nr:tetratricopeptide repeat protein [Anaerolineales bacterium HSG6]
MNSSNVSDNFSNLFVGRDDELNFMRKYYNQAKNGKGEIIFVIGEAGSGKSVLVRNFCDTISNQNENILIAVGECNALTGEFDSYAPFRKILNDLINIKEPDKSTTAKKIARNSLSIIFEYGPDLIGNLIPGTSLIALATQVAFDKSRIAEKIAKQPDNIDYSNFSETKLSNQYSSVIREISQNKVIILVLEDLHWIDSPSANLLFRLIRDTEEFPIFIIGTYRPNDINLNRGDGRHPMKMLLNEVKRYRGNVWLNIETISNDKKWMLVNNIIDAQKNRLSQNFKEKLFYHTGGSPLFVVELLHYMQEKGEIYIDEGYWFEKANIEWDFIPAKIEGIIQERISRLTDELRQALTIASVEGEIFTVQVLSRLQELSERQIINDILAELDKKHHLVVEDSIKHVEDQYFYMYKFRHIMLSNYLYDDLNNIEKQIIHKEIANVLEILYKDVEEEIALQLAYHYGESHIPKKMIYYLKIAGSRSFDLCAYKDCISVYNKALKITSNDNEKLFFLRHIGISHYRLGNMNNAYSLFMETISLAEKVGNDYELSLILYYLGDYLVTAGHFEDAEKKFLQILGIANMSRNAILMAHAYRGIGYVAGQLGNFNKAENFYKKCLLLCKRLDLTELLAMTLYDLGCTLHLANKWDKAQKILEKGINIAKKDSYQNTLSHCYNELGFLYFDRGSYRQALSLFQEGLTQAEKIRDKWAMSEALNGLGFVAVELDQLKNARSYFYKALQLSYALDSIPEVLVVFIGIAKLFVKLNQNEEAMKLLLLSLSHRNTDSEVKAFALPVIKTLESSFTEDDIHRMKEQANNQNITIVVNRLLQLLSQDSLIRSL